MKEELENKLIIYKASAGSGKTYTLVKEYLKLLVKRPAYYQNILAITFTNAATLEMKTRIIESLEEISKDEGCELGRQIKDELEIEDKISFSQEDIQNNARKALSNIINNYSRFEISTIDAFFNRLVKSMARELNLPLSYDIELDPEKALRFAIHQLYEMDEEEGQKVWVWLEEFAFSRIEDDKGWKIDNDILKIGSKIFDEKFSSIQDLDQLSDQLIDLKTRTTNIVEQFEFELKGKAEHAIKLINQSEVKFEWFHGGANRSIANNFKKIAEADGFETPIESLSKTLTKEKSWYAASSNHIDEIESLLQAGLLDTTEDLCEYFKENVRDYHTALLIRRNIYAYALLNAINNNLKAYRDEHNILFLSDNASLIHGILQKDDTPFIFEKTGSYYKHIFIDEFQDTSDFQWKNLLPLVVNALSDYGESHRIFVVGDVKQSIYRWRGGDMQLLMNGVEKDLKNYASLTEVKDLENNYRSKKSIVLFNNDFFNFCSEKIKLQLPDDPEVYRIDEVYGQLNQVPKDQGDGLVTVRFFKDAELNWKDQSKEELIRSLNTCFKSGYRKSDILILTSSNKEANDLANHLISEGIDVISQGSLLLNNVPVIQLILNILAYLDKNDDQIAKCGAVYWFHKIRKQRKEIDYNLIKNDFQYYFDQLPEQFSKRAKSLSRKPVYELIEELIVLFELDHDAGIFLQTFKELSLEHTAGGLVSIRQFLDWWYEEDRELSVTSTAELNSVKVMTIHKSKGLEAPVVFIPYGNFNMNSRESVFWTDKLEEDLEEFQLLPVDFKEEAKNSAFEQAYQQENIEQFLDTLNKAYVAFSRAREMLFIYSQQYSSHDDSKINNISRFLWSFCIRQENWNEVDGVLTSGIPQIHMAEKDTEEKISLAEFKIMGQSFMDKVNIRNFSANYYLLKDTGSSDKVEIGIKRHEVLSRLSNKEGLESVMQRLLLQGFLNKEEYGLIKSDIEELWKDPLFYSWFEPGWEIFAERSIISEGKVYQPDRVLIRSNETVIIDYKKDVEDPKHERQVRNYEALLEKMGYKNIRKYLVYMDNKRIKEVIG